MIKKKNSLQFGSISFLAVFLLLGLIFGMNPVHANSPPLIMQGSTAFPINSDFIVLERESIHIQFGVEEHLVEVMFEFHNTGPSIDLQIGFPNLANYGESIYDFKAFCYPEMTQYNVEKMPGGEMPGLDQYMYNSMYAWTMPFDENERKTLMVTYSYYNTRRSEHDGGKASYILKTGALWKDKIGRIDISVSFPENVAYYEVFAYPGGYHYNGQGIAWQFLNIEPDFDLEISYKKLPQALKQDWMYKPVIQQTSTDYEWDRKIFVIDLYDRWERYEPFYADSYGLIDIKKEAQKLLDNCELVENEIYARHGKALLEEWNAFFKQFSWYVPKPNFSQKSLNAVERLNLELIKTYRQHIHPDADKQTLINGIDALVALYGDAFFRYYPVFNREQNRENIQSFIDQRIQEWNRKKPVHLNGIPTGYLAPVTISRTEIEADSNGYYFGVSESGHPIFNTGEGKIVIEEGLKTFELYQKIDPGKIMYEQNSMAQNNQTILVSKGFHDWGDRRYIEKWCSEITHPEEKIPIHPLNDLLIFPETGEIFVLPTNFTADDHAVWSEDGNVFGSIIDIDDAQFLQTFNIKRRLIARYYIGQRKECRNILLQNDGSGFIQFDDGLYSFSLHDTSIRALGFSGEMIGFDHEKNSLVYYRNNEIFVYLLNEAKERSVAVLPKGIWKAERQDAANFILYCHPEYFYLLNLSTQKVYKYLQNMDWVQSHNRNPRQFSPSGKTMLTRSEYESPMILTKGDTHEQLEVSIPFSYEYEWLNDDEIILVERQFSEDSYSVKILHHVYHIKSGEKLYTRYANSFYKARNARNIQNKTYYVNEKPALSNALLMHPGKYNINVYRPIQLPAGEVPVGIITVGEDTSEIVYYNKVDNAIHQAQVKNEDLYLAIEQITMPVGFIMNATVYVDETMQVNFIEQCSSFVTVVEEKDDIMKIRVGSFPDGWVYKKDYISGFVSSENIQEVGLPVQHVSLPQTVEPIAADLPEPDEEGLDVFQPIITTEKERTSLWNYGIGAVSLLLLLAGGFFLWMKIRKTKPDAEEKS